MNDKYIAVTTFQDLLTEYKYKRQENLEVLKQNTDKLKREQKETTKKLEAKWIKAIS